MGGLFFSLHSIGKRSRALGQSGNLSSIKLAVEANAEQIAVLPPDDRSTAQSPAIQSHWRPDRKACLENQFGAAGRQVEEMDRMAVSVDLKKGRKRHLDPRKGAPVVMIVLKWNGADHQTSSPPSNGID